jgi:carbamoyl-phosphate synthase large subunit
LLSVGTRNKVVQYFKKQLDGVGKVVVTDMSVIAPALYEADEHYVVPNIHESNYIQVILDICKKEQISGVLSLIDPELSLLAKHNVSAYSTGGYVQESNRSVLVGHYAEEMISKFHADIAFFSAQSMDNNGEIYDCFEEENVIRKAMIKHASKRVFLCDSTKFGRTSPYHLCSLNDVDYIVSNHDLPDFIQHEKMPVIITE